MTEVYIASTRESVSKAISNLFGNLEKDNQPILKRSKEVYIKVNGIDSKKDCYTSPEVLEAVINYLKKLGAKVYVMENSTQCNITRLVFSSVGYKKICKRLGANVIYLDEENTYIYEYNGKSSIKEDPQGYYLKKFRLPKTIVKIMENRDEVTYINIPKLKTHSMAVVTLGIKNQWAFPQQDDRGKDHNYNLHSKLVDVYEYIQPDITIIDGIIGTIYGHYPVEKWADKEIIPFNILIGGRDTLAVDVVGARIFGFSIDEVPHLKIAYERGLGEGNLNKINVIGKNLNDYTEKYSFDLIQEFPKDVKIIKGKELLCREGCQNNTLVLLQVLIYDHNGKGGFFIAMGKGFDENVVEDLKSQGYTKGLVSGFCAIDEIGEKLRNAFGKKNVFYSHDCNNLAETTTAFLKLTGVSPFKLVPLSPLKSMLKLISAKIHGTKALIPKLF